MQVYQLKFTHTPHGSQHPVEELAHVVAGSLSQAAAIWEQYHPGTCVTLAHRLGPVLLPVREIIHNQEAN